MQRVHLQVRAVIEVGIIVEDQLKMVIEALTKYEMPSTDDVPGIIARPLVYARYNADIPMALPQLEDICHERGFILKTRAIAGGTEVAAQVELPQGDVTLESCLAQAVDREADEEFYSFVLALLKADEPLVVACALGSQASRSS